MKTHFIVALLLAGFSLAPHALAQSAGQFVPLAPIPGLTDLQPTGGDTLANFFNNLYKYLIGLSAAIALIMIIWGGIEYSTQDSISKKSDAKDRIYQAILGLVLILSPVLVFSIINPGILNLSVGFKPLDTSYTPSNQQPPPGFTTPIGSGHTSGVNGEIISCKPAGATGILQDCTDAVKQCENSAVVGESVSADVVCMANGYIDTRYTPQADPATTCPSGETKFVQCTTLTMNPGGV